MAGQTQVKAAQAIKHAIVALAHGTAASSMTCTGVATDDELIVCWQIHTGAACADITGQCTITAANAIQSNTSTSMKAGYPILVLFHDSSMG